MNASVALKQVYMRYLDRYEKLHFLGDSNERADDGEDENRHKKWNDKSHNEIPLKYNYSQHMVPGNNINVTIEVLFFAYDPFLCYRWSSHNS